ncbi:MAG: ABC transporter ATP-binding protein [Candidatus Pacebacteria bacterium]|nr:ABC transporter ATP-binding protein [Candidatus Paceibacterota bacterium]
MLKLIMLKIQNLKAGYGGMEILRGIDFAITAGEIVAVIGPNGAGKSTLLKSIFSLADIYSGKIFFKDKDITNLPTYQLISLGISFAPQGRQVFGSLTVLENLEMGAFIFKDKELVKRNIDDVFEKFPMLKEKKGELACNLSGGQQQMLAIGRALIQDPEILLFDEPSLGLDPKTMKEVFAKIQEINKEGISIVIVEQNAKQAVSIANRTYVLEDGKIALSGGAEILQSEKIKIIYLGGK